MEGSLSLEGRTIPAETPDQKARVEKLESMDTAQLAPLAVYLASDASQAEFSGDPT